MAGTGTVLKPQFAPGALLVLLLVAGCCSTPTGEQAQMPGSSPAHASGRTEQIHRQTAEWLARWPTTNRVDNLACLAEQIVDRLAAGGTLYLAGEPGFCDELYYRAGAFAGAVVWDLQQRVGSNDVLLVGWFDANSKVTREFKPTFIGQSNGRVSKALTIIVASARWPLAARMVAMADTNRWPAGLHLLDTDVPPTTDMRGYAVGQVATIAAAYALEGEMLAAATRRGRTMAYYPSMFAPGGEAYGELIKGKTFLDEPHLAPIPAGQIARSYLSTCREQVVAFVASDEPGKVRQVARQIVDCQRRGGTVQTVVSGHVLQRGATMPPELWSVALYGTASSWTPPHGLKAGDLLCDLGYLDYPQKAVDEALAMGVDVATLSVTGGPVREHVTNIQCFWKPYDGAVEIPGYPYKALPSSGVVMSAVWYSLMDEARGLVAAP